MEDQMSAYRDKINKQKEGGLYRVADFQLNGDPNAVQEFTHTIHFLAENVPKFEREIDILYFSDTNKSLQVNVTNAEILMNLFGDDPLDWPDHKVTLYLAPYGKEGKLGIRLRKPDTAPSNTSAAPTTTTSIALPDRRADMDDEIPF
jgi:hypothetical protein